MLEQGLSLEDEDIYGQTPLFYAAKENRLNIIHKIIEKKGIAILIQQIPITSIRLHNRHLFSMQQGKECWRWAKYWSRQDATSHIKIQHTKWQIIMPKNMEKMKSINISLTSIKAWKTKKRFKLIQGNKAISNNEQL